MKYCKILVFVAARIPVNTQHNQEADPMCLAQEEIKHGNKHTALETKETTYLPGLPGGTW